jgi:hypothetical protein
MFTAANRIKIKAISFRTVFIPTIYGEIIESETFFNNKIGLNLLSAYSIKKAEYKVNSKADLTFKIFNK